MMSGEELKNLSKVAANLEMKRDKHYYSNTKIVENNFFSHSLNSKLVAILFAYLDLVLTHLSLQQHSQALHINSYKK